QAGLHVERRHEPGDGGGGEAGRQHQAVGVAQARGDDDDAVVGEAVRGELVDGVARRPDHAHALVLVGGGGGQVAGQRAAGGDGVLTGQDHDVDELVGQRVQPRAVIVGARVGAVGAT